MLRSIVSLAVLAPMLAFAQLSHEHGSAAKARASNDTQDPGYSGFIRAMDASMKKMMQEMHSPGYAGNPDADFLAMMIPHHAGAVEMARLVLVHGRDPATRRLAEEIIASQVVEIEGMKRRLAALRAGKGGEAGEFPALGGTRGPPK